LFKFTAAPVVCCGVLWCGFSHPLRQPKCIHSSGPAMSTTFCKCHLVLGTNILNKEGRYASPLLAGEVNQWSLAFEETLLTEL